MQSVITATVSLTTTATSITSLIATAAPSYNMSADAFPGSTFGNVANQGMDFRCAIIQIIVPSTGTTILSGTPGTLATGVGVTLPVSTQQLYSAVTGNQLSTGEFFLSGTASTVGIVVIIL